MTPTIPKTMKAVQLVAREYEIHAIPVPQLGDNDLLIKVGAAGFCHTDYQVWEGVYKSPCPVVPSHEPIGTIVAVGKNTAGTWKVGQRAGVLLVRHACRTCVGCETTHGVRFCSNKDMVGLNADGGFVEHIIGDANNSVLLPDGLSFEQAAPLMCAGATIWGGIMEAGLKPSEPIGIIGIGGLGSLGVQFAKALGHPVVAVDDRSEGKELTQENALKADLVVNFNDSEAVEKINAWAGKGGLAGVVVSTDDLPAIQWSTKILRPYGFCVPLGLPTAGFGFDAFDVVFQMCTVKGSLVASKSQVEEMLKVVTKYDVRSHVTTVAFEEVPDLPEMYWQPH